MMDRCKGCCVSNSHCAIKNAKKEYTCPCPNCIVKMICGEACKEWSELYDVHGSKGAKDELPVS